MICFDVIGHMVTDGEPEELHTFAKRIGLKREWYQEDSGKHQHDKRFPHYDITTERMRKKALMFGAKLVNPREIVKILKARPTNEQDR
jgi:hypothetical protein